MPITVPRRCRVPLAAAFAAAACALGGLGGSKPAASAAPGSYTAASAASDAAAITAGDLAHFAVNSPAMIQAELIAVKYWNTSPCGGVVSVSWQPMDPSLNGASNWWNPVAAYGNAAANSDCTITLNQNQEYDWPMFCSVMVHEIGHLVGQQHSTDPKSVMYPSYINPIPECQVAPPAAAAAGEVPIANAAAKSAAGAHKAQSHHKKKKGKRHHKKHA